MPTGNVHLIAGGAEMVPQVSLLLEKNGVETHANPDLYVREYARFGIDEARELRSRAALKPIGDRRIFIVATPQMTSDAQNALLKTLEEPPADALFFFVVPAPRSLLETFRSRAQTLSLERASAQQLVDAKAFLAASAQKRLDMLKPLFEKDEEAGQSRPALTSRGEAGKRDLRPIVAFLDTLEALLAQSPEGLRALYRARKYLGDKGALVKPLLEQIALLTPKKS